MSTSSRKRIVEAASRRFYRDGFRNVGIDQVLADVGISKTAFYKHFESKDDLMLEALEEQSRFWRGAFQQAVQECGGTEPVGQLRALVDAIDRFVASSEFRGCIFINASIEFPLRHEPAHQAAAQHERAIEELVHEIAARADVDDPRALARELCLILKGAYITHHITGDPRTFDTARGLANAIIDGRLARTACRDQEVGAAALS